jgi:hypothetical protein
MALWMQYKGVAEEGNGSIDVLQMISDIALKVCPREVGESCCVVRMAGRTLVQNQLTMLYSSSQAEDRPTHHVFDKLRGACICVPKSLAVYEKLQLAFNQQQLMAETNVTHIRQNTVLMLASMYSSSLQREARVDTTHRREG